jgi:putative ATPase
LDLFDAGQSRRAEAEQPLAARLRPRSLDEFVGQEHILGPGRLLRRAIRADRLSSLVFYGPPGTGKTTLAAVIANTTRSHFITINAVLAGVADIRQAIADAQERRKLHSQHTILFVDEVHRFNKSQQDALLPWVESGLLILIGATTENPYFTVNRPLLSRSRVFQLKPLGPDDLRGIVRNALSDVRGYVGRSVELHEDALEHLVNVANGDARALLNALELAVETTESDASGAIHVTLEVAEESIQQRAVLYDKEGDYHFDTISAFIKSLRGSDPDATMYWLARMVYAGEEPEFIFRRMQIFASEDVGLADPIALQVVTAAADAFARVGLPEGRFPLAEAALYLATAPKSNSVFAFFDALASVEKDREEEVPNHLKDASRDSESFGHGANYMYPHAYRDHWVAQQYLPPGMQGRVFYEPSDQGHEATIRERVHRQRELQLAAMVDTVDSGPEGLSFSPPDRARDRWLQRAAGEHGAQLDSLRTRIFAALRLQRHHLVLDLDGGTGLLTWEALRQVPEGGVWVRTDSRTAAVALREMATHLPEVDRPAVFSGDLDELSSLVESREPGVRFDAVIGRNALAAVQDRAAVALMLRGMMQPDSALSLAETVTRCSQRLYQLLSLDELDTDLRGRLIQAEEEIYSGQSPTLDWTPDDLKAAMVTAGFADVSVQVEVSHTQRQITPQLLAHWFDPGGEKRPTYAHHLARHLQMEEIHAVQRLFERRLAHKGVSWSTSVAFLCARLAQDR